MQEIHFCHSGSKHASVAIQLPSLPTSDDLNNSNSPHLAVYYRFGKIDWMSSSERQVLLPLLHLPTLTSISLSSIRNFPLADLASCVSLKKTADSRFRVLDAEWCWEIFGGITPRTVDAWTVDDRWGDCRTCSAIVSRPTTRWKTNNWFLFIEENQVKRCAITLNDGALWDVQKPPED